jgi:hypothetical protein
MNILKEEDRYEFILDCLCKKVSMGEVPCPTPELLTAALRDLFPNFDIPPETGIAIHDGPKVYHYVDMGTEALPPNRNDVRKFRRGLSGLLQD